MKSNSETCCTNARHENSNQTMLLTLSGQPNTEKGKSAEENQVSKTSSSENHTQ